MTTYRYSRYLIRWFCDTCHKWVADEKTLPMLEAPPNNASGRGWCAHCQRATNRTSAVKKL